MSEQPTLSLADLVPVPYYADEHQPKPGEKSCFNCVHLGRWTESWEMPHIGGFECNARPANEHLRSFPFKNTTCKHWKDRNETNSP